MQLFLVLSLTILVSACAGVQSRYHEVSPGESLSKIASLYRVPTEALQDANIDSLRSGLRPGMKLYVPFESSQAWRVDIEGEIRRSPDAVPAGLDISKVRFSWPVQGFISSSFGWRNNRHHEGIDIPARTGTPVRAARSGHVIYAGNQISGYGNLIIVRHADEYSTVYAHLSRIDVKKGQFVTRGQKLGGVGKTGRASSPHLHFEIRSHRLAVDPMLFLPGQFAKN